MTAYAEKTLLRFTTTGSVDDGKSTLIGRLLYDTKAIFEDQYAAIQRTSLKKGLKEVDLALLLDGLSGNGNRALPSMWPTVTSRRPPGNSLSPIRRAMFNIRVTWSLAPPTPIVQSSCWMPEMAF